MRVWRICPRRRATTAFGGEGTRLAGSRWTHPGRPAVYTSESIALAVLETLVHLEGNDFPAHVVIPADLPDDLTVDRVNPADLSFDWFTTPAPPTLRDVGTDWLKRGGSVALRVPSAIVNDEYNWLLNPLHPDFERIRIGQPRAFAFDGRLWKRPPSVGRTQGCHEEPERAVEMSNETFRVTRVFGSLGKLTIAHKPLIFDLCDR